MGTVNNYPKSRRSVQPEALKYMREHPGVELHVNDIAGAINRAASSVGSALSRATDRPDSGIHAVTRGVYIYRPSVQTYVEPPVQDSHPETLYRRVGAAKSGALILESEDGTLYRAEEL